MEDALKHALELVKAQASVRIMSEDEMTAMIASLAEKIKKISTPEDQEDARTLVDVSALDAKKSIRERSITCLECGKTFKVISKRHLALHGLDAAAYREKWNLKKGTPLACKELLRTRRQKMNDMRLWEKRAAARAAAEK